MQSRSGFSVIEVLLIFLIVGIIVAIGVVVVEHFRQTSNASDISNEANSSNFSQPPFDCGDGTVAQADIDSFVKAYEEGRAGSLKILAVYGSNAMNFYATCHNLTTNSKNIYNTEYSYADAQPPPYSLSKSTCSLTSQASHVPTVNCGHSDIFPLQSQ